MSLAWMQEGLAKSSYASSIPSYPSPFDIAFEESMNRFEETKKELREVLGVTTVPPDPVHQELCAVETAKKNLDSENEMIKKKYYKQNKELMEVMKRMIKAKEKVKYYKAKVEEMLRI